MKLPVAFFAFLIGSLSCSAQDRASFTLRLHDASGAPIANAHVSLVRNRIGWPPESVEALPTPTKGQYSAFVASGVYDIFVSAPCFAPVAFQVRVLPGDHVALSERVKFQAEVQTDFVSDGCQEPEIIPQTPLIDAVPMPLPDRIQSSSGEQQR